MSPYRAVLLALFVVGGALTAAAPAGATVHDGAATPEVAAPTGDRVGHADARPTPAANDALAANNSTDNSSLGADISAFMQSNAAETEGAVETGMWTAAFNGTENQSVRAELVEKRTAELRRQLAELRERRNELVAEREAGNVSENAYKAKISRLVGEINALQSAIDSTTTRAKEVNASDASVETLGGLQTEAQNLTGPEMSTVAQNLTGVGNGEGGPPSQAGDGNGAGNGNAAEATSETASTTPDNAGNGNGVAGAGSGNGVANETGFANTGNETGVENGSAVIGAENGTDNGVVNATANRSRNSSGDGGDANVAASLATADHFDRVSTAFTAGIGPFAPA